MKRSTRPATLTGAVLAVAVISGAVWASAQSNPRSTAAETRKPAVVSVPAELTDREWANRVPAAAPQIKKIQRLYAQNPDQGRQAAADALRSSESVVRAYAANVLGAIGTDEQLTLLTERQQDEDVAVRTEAELAALRIHVRLAGNDAEKLASVLGPSFKSENAQVRLWAARSLAANPSPRARGLINEVLTFEQDPAVRSALGEK